MREPPLVGKFRVLVRVLRLSQTLRMREPSPFHLICEMFLERSSTKPTASRPSLLNTHRVRQTSVNYLLMAREVSISLPFGNLIDDLAKSSIYILIESYN